MKRKCNNCKTEFEFKAKDLQSTGTNGIYLIICPFCYTEKNVFYNHKPRHLNLNKSKK